MKLKILSFSIFSLLQQNVLSRPKFSGRPRNFNNFNQNSINNDEDCEDEVVGLEPPMKDEPPVAFPPNLPSFDMQPAMPAADNFIPNKFNNNNNMPVGDPDDCEEEINGLEPPAHDFRPAFDQPPQNLNFAPPPPSHDELAVAPANDQEEDCEGEEEQTAAAFMKSGFPSFDQPPVQMPSHDRRPRPPPPATKRPQRPSNDFQPLPPLPSHDELASGPANNDEDCEDDPADANSNRNNNNNNQDIFNTSAENEDDDWNRNRDQNDEADVGDFDTSMLENFIPSKWKEFEDLKTVTNARPKRMMNIETSNDLKKQEDYTAFLTDNAGLTEEDMAYLENSNYGDGDDEDRFQKFSDDEQYYLDFYAERG